MSGAWKAIMDWADLEAIGSSPKGIIFRKRSSLKALHGADVKDRLVEVAFADIPESKHKELEPFLPGDVLSKLGGVR